MGLLERILRRASAASYRVASAPRRLQCPHPDYADAYVVLPAEWLGEHALRKARAEKAAESYENGQMTLLAVALLLVDEAGNIPGLDGNDPSQWKLEKVPIPILVWVQEAVLSDYASAFTLPKAPSSPSTDR